MWSLKRSRQTKGGGGGGAWFIWKGQCHPHGWYTTPPPFYEVGEIRDWPLITGRGRGLQNGRGGGACEVLPKGGGGGKSFSHAEGGGGTRSLGVVFIR